jgi:sirohydrochlorin cobaltochelatase
MKSEEIEARVRTLVPAIYDDGGVEPVSMGSAGLKFGADGRVAWDEIWGSFCDLAMAGGPPHRGTILEPGGRVEIAEQGERYREVVAEICRGIGMVTGLHAEPSEDAGWVKMYCTSAAMAGWLARAIVMENVCARYKGLVLYLPAGPGYRLEKEIKNVVTAVAKTTHYWMEHTSEEQQQAIADVLRAMAKEGKVVQPGSVAGEWMGRECGSVGAAIVQMKAMVACHVLARREGTVVFAACGDGSAGERAAVEAAFTRTEGLGGA